MGTTYLNPPQSEFQRFKTGGGGTIKESRGEESIEGDYLRRIDTSHGPRFLSFLEGHEVLRLLGTPTRYILGYQVRTYCCVCLSPGQACIALALSTYASCSQFLVVSISTLTTGNMCCSVEVVRSRPFSHPVCRHAHVLAFNSPRISLLSFVFFSSYMSKGRLYAVSSPL